MSNSKFLSDSGWKDLASKNKIKDNGLLKVLADHKRLADDKHDDVLDALDEILKLAGQLKKAKDVAAVPGAAKYVAEVIDAAESDRRVAIKAKADADKANAKAEADKKAKSADKKDDGEDEEEEVSTLLTTKMVPLLRAVNKGERMHALVASAGKDVAVMLSRKPISPSRRKLLADELGGAGGIKYFVGHCEREEHLTTFVLKTQVAGLAKRLKVALLQQTGLRVKLRCRGEDGETDDDLEEPAEAAGGNSGADGEESAETGQGADTKAKSPELASAPQAWEGTREILQTNINALKKAVQAQVAGEGADLVDDINGQLQKLDRILGRLDTRLTDSLATAGQARDTAGRGTALRESKAIFADYIRYVSSEPLIDHLDSNPFGVKTDLKATLSKSLTQLARAIG